MKKRKQYSLEFKAQVVVEVLREEGTINEIAAKYEINPVMLSRWKTEYGNRSSDIFKKGPTARKSFAWSRQLNCHQKSR